jgi:predicted transcriptional regulator
MMERARQRQRLVECMRRRGMTFRMIAEALGISIPRAAQIYLQATKHTSAERYRENCRIKALFDRVAQLRAPEEHKGRVLARLVAMDAPDIAALEAAVDVVAWKQAQ